MATDNEDPGSTGRTKEGRFARGQSGNVKGRPRAGRPKGARNWASIVAENILATEAESIVKEAIRLALVKRDPRMLRALLPLVVSPLRERPISIKLPTLETLDDAVAAHRLIADALSRGEISAGEAKCLADCVDSFRSTLMATAFETRLHEIEARLKQTGQI